MTFGLVHARYSLPFICKTDPMHQLDACRRGGGGGGELEGGGRQLSSHYLY